MALHSKTHKLMLTDLWQHWNFREFDVGGNWKCLSVKKAERCRSSCVFRKKPRRCFDLCSFHTRRGCFSQVNHRDLKDGHIGSTNAKLALNRRKLDQNYNYADLEREFLGMVGYSIPWRRLGHASLLEMVGFSFQKFCHRR